jgi:coenzyme F420-0:L-glutamate ligase/coenzyme F420-1:gamma-L-glutamate ligase
VSSTPYELIPVEGIGEVEPGSRIGELIAARRQPREGDLVCISQKIVSKAEDRLRDLDRVEPSTAARTLAAELGKEPAMVELILSESTRVVRAERGVLITETSGGLICANGGIDASNVPGERIVALLPVDSDASARRIRAELRAATGKRPAVLITDSLGRPWRLGQSEVAIGCAGIEPIADWRGRADRGGRELEATVIAIADQIAAAADLARDKVAGLPVVLVRGLGLRIGADGPGAAALIRPPGGDLFR